MTVVSRDGEPATALVGVEGLFRCEYRRLVGLARLLVDDPGQAEEVVQEAFVALYRSWHRLRDPARRRCGSDRPW